MRNIKEIPTSSEAITERAFPERAAEADRLVTELETDGIVMLPPLLPPEQLRAMQAAFAARLQHLRWNHFDGFQRTEVYRHMLEDVLLLDQAFVDLAVHPLLKQILTGYLGTTYELAEAKGWKSLPTSYDFHGWHMDAWYDQTGEREIHKEVKMGMYLTDVRSGAFHFIKGSHRQQHPRNLNKDEVAQLPMDQLIKVTGSAGTAFLFDTSAIHRQGIPMLEPRQAIFFGYHDPKVRLQHEDVAFDRYHPLLLNAAFLGNLSDEDRRILGFGNKINWQPAFARPEQPSFIYQALNKTLGAELRLRQLGERISGRLKHTFGRSAKR